MEQTDIISNLFEYSALVGVMGVSLYVVWKAFSSQNEKHDKEYKELITKLIELVEKTNIAISRNERMFEAFDAAWQRSLTQNLDLLETKIKNQDAILRDIFTNVKEGKELSYYNNGQLKDLTEELTKIKTNN